MVFYLSVVERCLGFLSIVWDFMLLPRDYRVHFLLSAWDGAN